jgi:hypothetical protein
MPEVFPSSVVATGTKLGTAGTSNVFASKFLPFRVFEDVLVMYMLQECFFCLFPNILIVAVVLLT